MNFHPTEMHGPDYHTPQTTQVGYGPYTSWAQPTSEPPQTSPSPSGNPQSNMSHPMYYEMPSMPSGLSGGTGQAEPELSNPSHLTIPNHMSRSRSPIGNSSIGHSIPSPVYTYPPAFPNVASSMPQGLNARTSVATHGADNPLLEPGWMRMVNHHNDPWNPLQLREACSDSSIPQASAFNTYRQQQQLGSETESVRGPQSDSGYYTNTLYQHPSSVISKDERHDQEVPIDLYHLNVSSAQSESTEAVDLASVYSSRSTSHGNSRSTSHGKGTFTCQLCKEVSKCPSDFKKHRLKHDKPHTCDVPGCRRASSGKGFTTINDLMRHKKSVHRIGVERDSYQCASEHCRNKGKIWPRLDNFKQHISRMHKDEDEQDLIRRSAYTGDTRSLASAMTTPDITLAGIGMEGRQVGAGSELDDPVSGISLTPDQDEDDPWTRFNSHQKGTTMNIDQMQPQEYDQSLIAPGIHPGLEEDGKDKLQNLSPGDLSRKRQDSLRVLADVASTQPAPSVPPRQQLSSAPQTKAEQQRPSTHTEQQHTALQKIGQALLAEIRADPIADGAAMENALLRVLSGTAQLTSLESNAVIANYFSNQSSIDAPFIDAGGLSKTEAISHFIKQSTKHPPASPSRSRRTSRAGGSTDKIQCTYCKVITPRACDMKKHMKRHTKPYGCTYPKCHKRFGAKSDWKRHENSQHFQLEAFRCGQLVVPNNKIAESSPCGKLFHRVELFKQHLKHDHTVIDDVEVQDEIRARRIGKNGQGQFWCGFCQNIVKLKEKRNAAWDERFDHIDRHFNKDKLGIEEWLCVEARKKKGEIIKEMDRTMFDEEDVDEDGEDENDDSTPPANADGVDSTSYGMYDAPPPPPPVMPLTMPDEFIKKRQHPVEEVVPAPVSKRRRTDIERYCCACNNGPWLDMYVDCMVCNHHLCSDCPVDGVLIGMDGGVMLG